MSYYYEIVGPEVSIYSDASEFPVKIQVDYPGGKGWESVDAAKAWAESYIAYITDESAPVPKSDPEDEEKLRLTKEEILELINQPSASIPDGVPPAPVG